jgi:hypothetical protein
MGGGLLDMLAMRKLILKLVLFYFVLVALVVFCPLLDRYLANNLAHYLEGNIDNHAQQNLVISWYFLGFVRSNK